MAGPSRSEQPRCSKRTKTSKLGFEVGEVTAGIQETLTWHSIRQLPPWKDCRIWVIGASTGIGAATAKRCSTPARALHFSARKADALAEVGGGIRGR